MRQVMFGFAEYRGVPAAQIETKSKKPIGFRDFT